MIVNHCVYGLRTSDSRYPQTLPAETVFYPFVKPSVINAGMTAWEINKQNLKTERAKRWLHDCGKKDFNAMAQITKHTYICNLHFVEPIEENPEPILASSLTERTVKRKKYSRKKAIGHLEEKSEFVRRILLRMLCTKCANIRC